MLPSTCAAAESGRGLPAQRLNSAMASLWLAGRLSGLARGTAVVALVLTLPLLKNIVSPDVSYSVAMRLTAAAPPDAGMM